MLESRSAYHLNESPSQYNYNQVTIKYREYKTKYHEFKTVNGTYNADKKEIDVLIPVDHKLNKTNIGDRYKKNDYTFILEDSEGIRIAGSFVAKTEENAEKNALKFCKANNLKFVCKMERDKNIQFYRCKKVTTCIMGYSIEYKNY